MKMDDFISFIVFFPISWFAYFLFQAYFDNLVKAFTLER